MTRTQLLAKASEITSRDREQEYGAPEDNFAVIGNLWSIYLDREIDAYDVANLMALLKIARLRNRPTSMDSAIDLAGYAACAGEILSRQRGTTSLENPHAPSD